MLGGLELVCALIAGAAWYLRPELGPWPLLLIVAGRLLSARAGHRPVVGPATPFTLPLLLFVASAGLGAWVAYDRQVALAKFCQILGGAALAGSLTRAPDEVRVLRWRVSPPAALLALLPALIGVYFLVTNDWTHWAGKLAWLDPLTRWLAAWQPQVPGHRLHPNVAGGLLAALLPLQIAALARSRRRAGGAVAAGLMLAASVLGLFLTASRGAWVALGFAAATWWLGTKIFARGQQGKVHAPAQQRQVVGAWVLALLGQGGPALALPAALIARLALLRNSLDLALDYPFTGLGLGGYQMAYSSYVLLLHVGHTVHSHNLFLDVWIEQGLAGLLALIWLLAAAVATLRYNREAPSAAGGRWCLPAIAALLVILAHGLVDDAFYGSRAVLLLFVPFGLLGRTWAARQGAGQDAARWPGRGHALAGVAAAILAATVLLLPGVRAAFQANLGALAQTQAELSRYRWPDWPIQDALRRSPEVDLAPAVRRYQAALALDPDNATANRRLGQIALSTGRYEQARQYLARAYRAAPGQRATRQMLGEAYAIGGDAEAAAALWRTIDLSEGQLDGRQWWYGDTGDQQAADRIADAARLAAFPD